MQCTCCVALPAEGLQERRIAAYALPTCRRERTPPEVRQQREQERVSVHH